MRVDLETKIRMKTFIASELIDYAAALSRHVMTWKGATEGDRSQIMMSAALEMATAVFAVEMADRGFEGNLDQYTKAFEEKVKFHLNVVKKRKKRCAQKINHHKKKSKKKQQKKRQ